MEDIDGVDDEQIGGRKLPSIDPIHEEHRLKQQVEAAREANDFKKEAQAILQLGHLARQLKKRDEADKLLKQAASICRYHTMVKVVDEENSS